MEIMHRLQQSIATCDSTGTCECTCTCIGIGTSVGTCIGTGVGAQDVDYCLTLDGLVRFRDRIYVLDRS